MALRARQRRFCDEYMANGGNAYQAALKAGYAEKTAHDANDWVREPKNPKKPHKKYNKEIAAYIAKHSTEIEEHNEKIATAEELQEFTSRVVRGEIGETVVSASGKKVEVPASLKDRLKGVDMLARMKGLYNDRMKIDGAVPVVISGYDEIED